MKTAEVLRQVPKDVLKKGSQEVIDYVLDLCHSPSSEHSRHSKLLIVGPENIGKSSLMDALFKLQDKFEVHKIVQDRTNFKLEMTCSMEGRFLKLWDGRKDIRIELQEGNHWQVHEITPPSKKKAFEFDLIGKENTTWHFVTQDQAVYRAWVDKLRRVVRNAATHGINVREGKLGDYQLSLWDFAGQHEYYTSHQFFLSTRSVFLLCWKLPDGKRGLKEVGYWLRSISGHLLPDQLSKYYSIIIVGTFLDHERVPKGPADEEARREMVSDLAEDCGFDPRAIPYLEVSSATLAGVSSLRDQIAQELKKHEYMRHRIPKMYVLIREALHRIRAERIAKNQHPILEIAELRDQFGERELVMRALDLFSQWGDCVYFRQPVELSTLVILDPKFLTQGVLAQLFNPMLKGRIQNGILQHKDLVSVWSEYKNREDFAFYASTFASLMQKMEILFTLEDDKEEEKERAQRERALRAGKDPIDALNLLGKIPFELKKSVIPALLPRFTKAEIPRFREIWPKDPPPLLVQYERVIKFSVMPREILGRYLVRLRHYIIEGLIWKNAVIISTPDSTAWAFIKEEIPLQRLLLFARGSTGEQCQHFLFRLVEEMETLMTAFQGVIMSQGVTSPYYPYTEISLQDIHLDQTHPISDRGLICPKSKLPLLGEGLLLR